MWNTNHRTTTENRVILFVAKVDNDDESINKRKDRHMGREDKINVSISPKGKRKEKAYKRPEEAERKEAKQSIYNAIFLGHIYPCCSIIDKNVN
ncbi:hypothetical protein WUBG_06811 [Wuchereria bancrofti]|uniref:Uncharacterized protein n=1 Tax=Wuchereria bancrofti TaxID=6293 RepID=J9F4L5_WUCBA|nr:hypothetical protein WUBG_06811 [Wuchereria bancrofti]